MDVKYLFHFSDALRSKTTRRKLLIAGCVLSCLCIPWAWKAYASQPKLYTPFFTPVAALLAGLVALGQLRVTRSRHEEQTKADFRRRVSETYSKAVSQLASDKIEERLGGVYTLENISKESPDDYWTVMQTLTAFVRERSQRNYAEFKKSEERISLCAYALWETKDKPKGKDNEIWAEAVRQGEPPAADIAAVLTVITRRVWQNQQNWEREKVNVWKLDLRSAVLKQAFFQSACLEGADLRGAHLEGADLNFLRLEEADLCGAHLEGAELNYGHLKRAKLTGAHLEGAYLENADLRLASLRSVHLEGAVLVNANLKEADLKDAHLERANLERVDLKGAHLLDVHLEGAHLLDAHLKGVTLVSANLKEAHLRQAHLEGAVLANADLKEADLKEAHLEGADLQYAKGLTTDQLLEAHGDGRTQLPKNVTRPAHWQELAEPSGAA